MAREQGEAVDARAGAAAPAWPLVTLGTLRYVLAGIALWVALQYSDDPVCLLINASLLLLPWLALSALSGRGGPSLGLAALLAIGIYALGELKLAVFGDRLAAADALMLLQPDNWKLLAQGPAWPGLLAGIGALLLVLLLDARLHARRVPALGVLGRLSALLGAIALAGFCVAHRDQHRWDVFREDADCGDLRICGVFSRLVYSTSAFHLQAAEAADPQYFRAHVGPRLGAVAVPPPAGTRPDLIVWVNESTFDPAQYQLPGANLPTLRLFTPGPHTVAHGLLRTHVGAEGEERAPLARHTGLAPARDGTVFDALPTRVSSSLVRLLKAQGYHTMALLPTYAAVHGAVDAGAVLGVDQVLSLGEVSGDATVAVDGDSEAAADSARIADAARTLVARFHAAAPEQPLFLYLVSARERGPYASRGRVAWNLDRAGLSPTLARRLSDYVGRLRQLDAAVVGLESRLMSQSRPTLLCWFGDHQPQLEEPPPAYRFDLPVPATITQYQVSANFTVRPEAARTVTDVAFLPSLLVDLAGVERDRTFAAMSSLRRWCDGRLENCPDADLARSYHGYAYGERVSLRERLP